jgi:hypothetical protein
MVPALLGALVVLMMRAAAGGSGSLPFAVAEIAAFLSATAAATWALEGSLVREALGYVLERRRAGVAPA